MQTAIAAIQKKYAHVSSAKRAIKKIAYRLGNTEGTFGEDIASSIQYRVWGDLLVISSQSRYSQEELEKMYPSFQRAEALVPHLLKNIYHIK
jgi:hypothetical protein